MNKMPLDIAVLLYIGSENTSRNAR